MRKQKDYVGDNIPEKVNTSLRGQRKSKEDDNIALRKEEQRFGGRKVECERATYDLVC